MNLIYIGKVVLLNDCKSVIKGSEIKTHILQEHTFDNAPKNT